MGIAARDKKRNKERGRGKTFLCSGLGKVLTTRKLPLDKPKKVNRLVKCSSNLNSHKGGAEPRQKAYLHLPTHGIV